MTLIGTTVMLLRMETTSVAALSVIGPTLNTRSLLTLAVPYHMALATIVVNSRHRMHVRRCSLVKLLRDGRPTREIQRWSSNSFLRALSKNRWLNVRISSRLAIGRMRSINPSSSSTANQRPHRKKYLKYILQIIPGLLSMISQRSHRKKYMNIGMIYHPRSTNDHIGRNIYIAQ